MKVSLDLKNKNAQNHAVSFSGFKATKSDDGFKEYEFSYPYDSNADDCYLEVYKLDKDKYNNYFSVGKASNRFDGSNRYKMTPGVNKIDFSKTFGIDDNTPFAYHYVLENKNSKYKRVRIDAGDSIDERGSSQDPDDKINAVFNIAIPTKSGLSKGGAMKLVIIDSQKVGYVYNDHNVIVHNDKLAKRGENGIKTLTNKFGGTLAGLEHAVDNGEYDGYGRIISLPVFTDDDFTSHSYWNKNCMQMASSLGNINNYASLQRKMFAHGLNFVSDGAFVNEGLEGVHFKHMLKWGVDSPYFNWFRASGLKDNPLSMGVFVKNKDFISHKIVNSPYTYTQNKIGLVSIKKKSKGDPTYDPKKPTYIQFFDTRLVSNTEKNDTTSLIKTYSKMSTDNVYDLHTHNDSVFPYAFEIDPKAYNDNIKRLNEYNAAKSDNIVDIDSPLAARILSKFKNFEVEGKFESGFETWDANPDIAKLNYVFSHADTKSLKNIEKPEDKKKEMSKILRANAQVQDYAVTSGQYWTQKTDDILRMSVAQNLKRVDKNNPSIVYDQIMDRANGKVFPKSLKSEITKDEVINVLYGMYQPKRKLSNEDKKSQIIQGLMNTPLDSFEFGDNIVSVLASPLVSKRATTPSEIGVSRYDIFKSGNKNLQPEYRETYEQMDKLYTNELASFATSVLDVVDKALPTGNKLFDGDKVTDYGKYVLPLVTPGIMKYAAIKSLAPDLTMAINKNNGEITYDYKTLKSLTLEGVGVTNPASPKDEAKMLLDVIKKGTKHLDSSAGSEIVDSILKSIKDTSVESFELADLIIDKTQSGLDWRIDATKDIADVEALRNENTNFDYTWQSVINFWKKFNTGVLQNNPNAYLVAEITDENTLHNKGLGYHSGKFPKYSDIVSKFQRETGMTSTANYSYFFTDIAKMFTSCFEDGSYWNDSDYLQKLLFEKMVGGGDPYLKSGSLDSIEYSYTFIGNHDKPRALHCAALDLGMFYTDLNYVSNYDNRLKAYKMINNNFFDYINPNDVNNYDFSAVSPKAVAMGYALRKAFIDVLNDYKDNKHQLSDYEFNEAFKSIGQAISDLSQGKFMGKRFDADAFGIKPFDVSIAMVLKQARSQYNLQLPSEVSHDFENVVFEKALDPAISKLLGMMKYLVALPGMPTLFDGDDVGATGYDTKTKNMYLQGRQRVHDEWLDVDSPKYKSFIAKHKKEFDDVMSVRKNPKCNALNNGAPFTLPIQKSEQGVKCPAILRQSTDGRMALSVFNTSNLHHDSEKYYDKETQTFDSIKLNFETTKDGKTIFENGENGVGVTGLNNNTVFVNAKDPNDKYYVNELDGKYFLKRGTDNGKITLDDTTLILYHVPDKTPLSFTGRCDVKPSMHFISNVYTNKTSTSGKKLALYK